MNAKTISYFKWKYPGSFSLLFESLFPMNFICFREIKFKGKLARPSPPRALLSLYIYLYNNKALSGRRFSSQWRSRTRKFVHGTRTRIFFQRFARFHIHSDTKTKMTQTANASNRRVRAQQQGKKISGLTDITSEGTSHIFVGHVKMRHVKKASHVAANPKRPRLWHEI